MKHNFMMALAAAALVTGTGLASAQGTKSEKEMPGASSMERKGSNGAEQRGQSTQSQQGTQRPAQGAQREQSPPAAQGTQDRDTRPQGAQRDQRPDTQPGQRGTPSTAESQPGSAGANVTLSTEQKAKIRQTIIQRNDAPRVTNVNFSLSVGTVVPRERLKLVAVPPTLVEIHPAWRGYLYFIVNDELIIVEPSTHRIVAVIAV